MFTVEPVACVRLAIILFGIEKFTFILINNVYESEWMYTVHKRWSYYMPNDRK